MNVLHLLAAGGAGGIETLSKDYAKYSKLNNYFMFIWFGGITAEQMKKDGNHVSELNASKKDIWGPYRKILSLCKKENIDVIIVHHASPMMHLYAMWVKRKISKLHIVIYAHASAEDICRINIKKGLRLRKFIINLSLHKCDRIIAISKFVKESLISFYGINESKINIIYNGVDLTRFTGIPHEPKERVELIYVGRLIKQKGVQNTVHALALVPINLPYRFRIVGDGVYKKELEMLTKELKLENHVEFYGIRQDIPELLKTADIFIHIPNWEEGFGITIVEAMAAGVLPVCAYKGAIPEIIKNNVNGILVNQNNIKELANTLTSLMKNIHTEYETKMRTNAIKRAYQFSSESFANKLDLLISDICKAL